MKSGTDISMIHTTEDDDDEADNDVRRDYLDQQYAIGVILSQLPLRSSRTKRRWRYDNDDDNEHEERTERISSDDGSESNAHIIMARFIH
mmetsp:Transcript_22283/g.22621  ORF Transcript_22283/g.22621 Transcript_22283/m.22621 type:complete len:90 (-) Transcript_22283:118-387(-)